MWRWGHPRRRGTRVLLADCADLTHSLREDHVGSLRGEGRFIQLEQGRTGRRQLADLRVDCTGEHALDAASRHAGKAGEPARQCTGMRHRHQLFAGAQREHDVGRGRQQGRHAHQCFSAGGGGNATNATVNTITPAMYHPGIEVRKYTTPPSNASISPNAHARIATLLARAMSWGSRNFMNITIRATLTTIHAIRAILLSWSPMPGSGAVQSGDCVRNQETPPNRRTPPIIARRIACRGVIVPASGTPLCHPDTWQHRSATGSTA